MSALFFVLATGLVFELEEKIGDILDGAAPRSAFSARVFDISRAYEYLVTGWPRHQVPRYTVLVELDTKNDVTAVGLASNICLQRAYLAQLLPAISEQHPATIVIDKSFAEEGCIREQSPDLHSTQDLQEAIAHVSSKIPVVVGLKIEGSTLNAEGFITPSSSLQRAVQFPFAPLQSGGIMSLDVDNRRIALGWDISRNGLDPPQHVNSLALQAALVYDEKLLDKYDRLRDLIVGRESPFMSFIDPSKLIRFNSGDLICEWPKVHGDLKILCQKYASSQQTLHSNYLRGRIVLIGEVTEKLDIHRTIIGDVRGAALQVNAIEAILDERYFLPASGTINLLVGFIFYLLLEISLRTVPVWLSIVRTVILTVGTFFILAFSVRYFAYYISPAAGLVGMAFRLLAAFAEILYSIGTSHEKH
ncbi:CHASE2 domain-containing protein [Variovorax sp. dw_954]|uniref:CHASE2 domain-containing protein n=1 Tax=Variovorax sp. dw_954 TaxID=2720078 RepID=UPI001BD5BA2F